MIPVDLDDVLLQERRTNTLGVSPLPIFLACLITWLLFLLLLALAFQRLKSPIPLPGTCSAAISAACHPPREVCTETVALGELMWGETGLPADWGTDESDDDNNRRGHCSFTPLDARQPDLDKLYA